MLRSALVFIAASSYIAIASGIHHHFPAFVSASSLKAPGGQRHTGAFIENNKELSLQKRLAVSMALSPDGNDLSDAEAYHDMASASVDFTNIMQGMGWSQVNFWLCLTLGWHHLFSRKYLFFTAATRSVSDIDRNSRRQFLYNIHVASQSNGSNGTPPFVAPPIELPTKIKARIPSPSGSKIAILVEESIPARY